MSVHPVQISRKGEEQIVIDWSDGQKRLYTIRDLRKNCPCATCASAKAKEETQDPMQLRVIPISETQPLRLLGMKPVGKYAYDLQFSDGHYTGIYTFEILLRLGEAIE